MKQQSIVQDDLKFYLETRDIDIATYKISRVDVSDHFKDAYFKRASDAAKVVKTWPRIIVQLKAFTDAISKALVSTAQAVENIAKALSSLNKKSETCSEE